MEFGTELRRRRVAAGKSLTALSTETHYSRSHLSKVETGAKNPSPDLARTCDRVLKCGGELALLVPPSKPMTQTSAQVGPNAVWLLRMDDTGRSCFVTTSSREVEASGLFGGLAAGAGQVEAPMVVAGAITSPLASFRTMFTELRRLGQQLGPETLLPMLIAQTQTLRALAERSTGRDRSEALLLAAHYAEFTGWMAQENGSIGYAAWWTERAVEFASAAGDQNMAAYALIRRGLVSMYQHDATETVTLAQRAKLTTAVPRIRGLAAQREAQGHALAGNRDACLAAFDEARELLDRPADDEPERPVLGSTYVPDPVTAATGWAMFDLGAPEAAAKTLRIEYDRIPRHALRSRARFGARLALALACSSDVDEACAIGEQVVDDFLQVRSATIRTDLCVLARTLRHWHRYTPAEDLGQRLTSALHQSR